MKSALLFSLVAADQNPACHTPDEGFICTGDCDDAHLVSGWLTKLTKLYNLVFGHTLNQFVSGLVKILIQFVSRSAPGNILIALKLVHVTSSVPMVVLVPMKPSTAEFPYLMMFIC